MRQKHMQVNLGFTKQSFPQGMHMCLIYSDEAERKSIISKFIESGIATDEKVGYFADMMKPAEVRQWLANRDVELPENKKDDSFEILAAEESYCPTGEFIPETMLTNLKAYYSKAKDDGYAGARIIGEAGWTLRGIPGSDRFMEYEALVNNVVALHPVTALCQYNTNLFDGAVILDVLKVHPFMIVQGQVVKNPYYLKPEDFLKEFTEEI